jgi:hypothetical protein
MRFVYGEVPRSAVQLPSTGINNADPRIHGAAAFKQAKMRRGISSKILQRVSHRIDVTYMPRQVEYDINSTQDLAQFRRFPEVECVDLDRTGNSIEVFGVPAA